MNKPLSEWTPEERLRWGGWEDLKRREDLRTVTDATSLDVVKEAAALRRVAAGLTHGEALTLMLAAREVERQRRGKYRIAESSTP